MTRNVVIRRSASARSVVRSARPMSVMERSASALRVIARRRKNVANARRNNGSESLRILHFVC